MGFVFGIIALAILFGIIEHGWPSLFTINKHYHCDCDKKCNCNQDENEDET